MQPAMRPLYDTRQLGDILLGAGRLALAEMSAEGTEATAADTGSSAPTLPDGDFYEVLREEWRGIKAALDAPEEPAAEAATDPAATTEPAPADGAAEQDPAAARRAAAAARRAAAAARQAARSRVRGVLGGRRAAGRPMVSRRP